MSFHMFDIIGDWWGDNDLAHIWMVDAQLQDLHKECKISAKSGGRLAQILQLQQLTTASLASPTSQGSPTDCHSHSNQPRLSEWWFLRAANWMWFCIPPNKTTPLTPIKQLGFRCKFINWNSQWVGQLPAIGNIKQAFYLFWGQQKSPPSPVMEGGDDNVVKVECMKYCYTACNGALQCIGCSRNDPGAFDFSPLCIKVQHSGLQCIGCSRNEQEEYRSVLIQCFWLQCIGCSSSSVDTVQEERGAGAGGYCAFDCSPLCFCKVDCSALAAGGTSAWCRRIRLRP